MTRFRTSSHKLHIEIGRYTIPKTPIDSRICKNCNINLVEDELHFLLSCQNFSHLRKELIYNCLNKTLLIPQILILSLCGC